MEVRRELREAAPEELSRIANASIDDLEAEVLRERSNG